MLQPSLETGPSWRERLRSGAGRRATGLALALAIEGLLIFLLISLGSTAWRGDAEEDITFVSIEASEPSAEQAPEPEPEREPQADERPVPQPRETAAPAAPSPLEPTPLPTPRAVIPTPFRLPPAAEPRPARPARPNAPAYGPPSPSGSTSGDTARVGTAPNGQPLYAARWYREPRDDELAGYLSTASGPGWGLIACRTAPDFRVEDCVGLDEYPNGSQITRAVLAAAWQFKVRPPQLGGVPQVGSWVRIRIDYGIERR